MSKRFQWQWIPVILIYAASALEVVLMVTPFAAFFYSVYTPIIDVLALFEATAWLPQFFLPHLAQSTNMQFAVLAYMGPLLAGLGLLGFVVCAGQLYYGKFVQKKLVSSGLYGRVRHPQYLCLSVSGLGFLLMWPRFFILVTFLGMLGVYYLLARHEEEVVRQKYGKASERYMARIAMFNPFRAPKRAKGWRPASRAYAFGVWVSICVLSISLSFILRMEAETQLFAVRWESPNVMAISLMPRDESQIVATMESVMSSGPVLTLLEQQPDIFLLLQIANGKAEAEHLLSDLGMKTGAVQLMQLPLQGEYVAVSYLSSKDRPVAPFSLDTRVNPILFVQTGSPADGPDVRPFIPEQFYPDFYRIMF
jgi:protein-S-isoprenylcysteine O-methyltransferase Ste14